MSVLTQMMSGFLKTTEGRWNGWILVLLPLLVISAVQDFYRDGWSSLTGVQCLLMAGGVVAYALRPPRRAVGAAAFVAVAAILAYRIAREILHW